MRGSALEANRDGREDYGFLFISTVCLDDYDDLPGPSFSRITSQWNALLVTFEPVEWSVERVELLRSMGFGGGSGGDIAFLYGERKGDAILACWFVSLDLVVVDVSLRSFIVTYVIINRCVKSIQRVNMSKWEDRRGLNDDLICLRQRPKEGKAVAGLNDYVIYRHVHQVNDGYSQATVH